MPIRSSAAMTWKPLAGYPYGTAIRNSKRAYSYQPQSCRLLGNKPSRRQLAKNIATFIVWRRGVVTKVILAQSLLFLLENVLSSSRIASILASRLWCSEISVAE